MSIESITSITVDVANHGRFTDNVVAMQADNATRYVHVTVLNNDHPVDLSNLYPVIRGTKSDGTAIFNQCSIEDGVIVVELTSQILASPGICQCEIALYQILPNPGEETSNGVITAFPFNIIVVPVSFNASSIVSSDEFTVLEEAMAAIPSIATIQDFEDAVLALQEQVGNHTVATDVPANAVFTDTTYGPVDSTNSGLMTPADYIKLTNVESGAEVNQNAFSNVFDGTVTIQANSKTDTLNVTGSHVHVSGNSSSKTLTISIDDDDVKGALGYTPASLVNGKIPASELPGGIGTTVTASLINGNIKVDGDELQVYRYTSDTGLLNYIQDQINSAVILAINSSY